MSKQWLEFDTTIELYDEGSEEYYEKKVCVSGWFEAGYPSTFNPARECYDEPASDDIEIDYVYDYETGKNINLNDIPDDVFEKLEEKALEEAREY